MRTVIRSDKHPGDVTLYVDPCGQAEDAGRDRAHRATPPTEV